MARRITIYVTIFLIAGVVAPNSLASNGMLKDLPISPKQACKSQWCEKVRILRTVVIRADRALARSVYSQAPLRRELVGIVRASRSEGLSPFFILAIAGVESGFGAQACGGNAWGWGSCSIGFNTFTQGAQAVANGLKLNYLGRGLTGIDSISRVYCPPRSSFWATNVRFFMNSVFHVEDGLRWTDAVKAVYAGRPS